MEKFQFFSENYWLTLLEKYQNFDFFNFVILESKYAFLGLFSRQ